MPDPDDVVSSSRQISLTRPPELSRDLVAQYRYVESEQQAIKRCMRERVEWGEREILPEDLLEQLQTFISHSSGEFRGRTDGGEVQLECEQTGTQLRLEGCEGEIDVSVLPEGEEDEDDGVLEDYCSHPDDDTT